MKRTWLGAATLLLAVGAVVVACSSTNGDGDGDSGDGGGTRTGDPVVSASDCEDACLAKASECGAPAGGAESQCGAICGRSPTESQVACLSARSCAELARLDGPDDFDVTCKKGTSPTPSTTSTPTAPAKDSGPAACIALGKGGCSSLNAPSGCCSDSAHPTVVCNGNNDGKGNAQCCVNIGKACTAVTDCCGYAGANEQTKKLYRCDGTCKL